METMWLGTRVDGSAALPARMGTAVRKLLGWLVLVLVRARCPLGLVLNQVAHCEV